VDYVTPNIALMRALRPDDIQRNAPTQPKLLDRQLDARDNQPPARFGTMV